VAWISAIGDPAQEILKLVEKKKRNARIQKKEEIQMPGFDGTGPLGEGPMTGGGFGYCGTGRRSPLGLRGRAFSGRFGAGRGFGGFGRGLGRAYGRPYFNRMASLPAQQLDSVDVNEELAALQQKAEEAKAFLEELTTRIAELEKASQ
jgi:hypothetical protein